MRRTRNSLLNVATDFHVNNHQERHLVGFLRKIYTNVLVTYCIEVDFKTLHLNRICNLKRRIYALKSCEWASISQQRGFSNDFRRGVLRTKTCSESSRTSKMEIYAKMVNTCKLFTTFGKRFILAI